MTGHSVSSVTGHSEAIFGELKEYEGWLFGMGVLFIIPGVVGLGRLFALSMAGNLFFWSAHCHRRGGTVDRSTKMQGMERGRLSCSNRCALCLRRRFCDSGALGG